MNDGGIWSTHLLLKNGGEVDVSERTGQAIDGSYESQTLIRIETAPDEVDVSIWRNVEEDDSSTEITLSMSAYHQENPETKRVFHAALDATLTLDQVRAMHAYLGLLLKLSEADGEP
jgi:hypothetical protein